jgi:hypothetical protein
MSAPSVAKTVALAAWLAAATASAQTNTAERVSAFAKLPNWTGIWIADDGVMSELGLSGRSPGGEADFAKLKLNAPLPYNAEWAARVDALRNRPGRETDKECGFPFPFVMESPWVFQFLVTPEETAMIVGGREIRHIYTDGRDHPKPEDLWPTPWGDSVGRWDGHVLIVDTVAVQQSRFPPIVSDQARFSERIEMVSPDRMVNVLSIVDPEALTAPWTVTIPYKRVTELDRMVHGDCTENDRNPVVEGKLTIAPATR